MTHSYYTGTVAYIKQTRFTDTGLRALAELIPALRSHVDMLEILPISLTKVNAYEAALEVQARGNWFQPLEGQYPIGTHESYKHITIGIVAFAGTSCIRLYIPCVGDDKTVVDYVAKNALGAAIKNIFQSNLVCVKTRSGSDSEHFNELTEEEWFI